MSPFSKLEIKVGGLVHRLDRIERLVGVGPTEVSQEDLDKLLCAARAAHNYVTVRNVKRALFDALKRFEDMP